MSGDVKGMLVCRNNMLVFIVITSNGNTVKLH